MNEHQVTIGTTYFNQNYFNVGVAASNHLGNHNEPLKIVLTNGQIINSTINRTINSNESVRFYCGAEWHQFIVNNYHIGNVIRFQITNANTITILTNV